MQSSEVILALVLAIIAIIAGYLLFRHFFDLNTLKPKPQFQGMRQRIRARIRVHAGKVALIVGIVVAAGILAYLGLHFGGPLVKTVSARIHRVEAASQPMPPASSLPAAAQPAPEASSSIVADHLVVNEVRLDRLSPAAIEQAKSELHIFFIHGTYGSQITYGLKGLSAFKGPLYDRLDIESLELDDREEPDLQAWADRTRSYLDDPDHRNTNVVMWSWSDELSSASEQTVADYFKLMSDMEGQYPRVHFIYMTGHVDGTGPNGNVSKRNEQIRSWCRENGKILYDFADIESYDPDGNYYGDKLVNDGCWYDSDANGSLDRNWAKDWSEANPGKWYDCYAAHSFPLNANLKAYAAWWLWVKLAEEKLSGENN